MNRVFTQRRRCAMLGGMSKSKDSVARWREIMRSQARSGLSIAAYCRRACVSEASFYAWRRKLRDAGSFAEVRVTPESAGEAGAFEVRDAGAFEVRDADALELRLKRGRRIVVRPGFDRATLLALVDTLERSVACDVNGMTRSVACAANGMTWSAADVADREAGA